MLLGLGVTLVVVGNSHTNSVDGYITRVLDDQDAETKPLNFERGSGYQWFIKGALGGPNLGFPTVIPNYYTPQCFRIDIIARNRGKSHTSSYYFWVAEGLSGAVIYPQDRFMSSVHPFTCCIDGFPSPQLLDPDMQVSSVLEAEGLEGCEHDVHQEFLPGNAEGYGFYNHETGDPDPVLEEPAVSDPFTPAPYPAIPAALSEDEVLIAGLGTWVAVADGGDYKWHLEQQVQIADITVGAAPGETKGQLDTLYATADPYDLPTVVSGANQGIAIFEGECLLTADTDQVSLGAGSPTSVEFTVSIPQGLRGGDFEYIVIAGEEALWDTPTTNQGAQIHYKTSPSVFTHLLTAVNDTSPAKAEMWDGSIWRTAPTSGFVFTAPVSATEVSFFLKPSGLLSASDIWAVQVVCAPAGTIDTLVGGAPFGIHLPYSARLSNVYKVEVVL